LEVVFLLWAGSVGDFQEGFAEALGHELASLRAAHLVDEAVGEGIEHGGEARGEVYLVFLEGFFGVGEADGLAGGRDFYEFFLGGDDPEGSVSACVGEAGWGVFFKADEGDVHAVSEMGAFLGEDLGYDGFCSG
jgi:hypothetical protein